MPELRPVITCGETALRITVPPTPGVLSVPGVKPTGPYSSTNVPVQAEHIQLTLAWVELVPETATPPGMVQGGAGLQVTEAVHPAWLTEPSEVNAMVKQPVASEEVNGPGIAVPHQPPVPYTLLPAGTPFVLAILGEATLGPSNTYNGSQPDSVWNALKVTVTRSPGESGQIVVTWFALFGYRPVGPPESYHALPQPGGVVKDSGLELELCPTTPQS